MTMLFSDEQIMIRDMARKFAEDELQPHSEEWDQTSHFPVDVIRKAAELGFASIYVKEDVGGAGLTRTDAALIFEQLAYGDVSTAAFISIHNMASWMIDTFGADEQRQAWLPRLTTMELIASYCLTEPGAGSDAASLKTKAVREGDEYVITGTKQFISGAGTSDVYVLMARTSEDGAKGVSAFIIEKDTPGLSFGANERKMGWKSQPTRQVILDGVRVPVANRIGEEGHGFKFAMAKRFVTDTAFKVANDSLQIHGGYGYLADYGVERIVRDLRVHQILEGTNEIMRVIISRDMLKD